MAKKAASRKTARGRKTARKGAAKKSARRATTSARGRSTRARKTSGARRTSGGGRGKANAAFMRPVNPSPALAEVVGNKPIPRSEVTKRLWAYIKKNRLQDQKNKRMINADSALKPVFGGKSAVNMFEMTKLVGRHLK